MPYIEVKTNISADEGQLEKLKSDLGQAITKIPGKTESWLMVAVEIDCKLWFKGSDDAAAMVKVDLLGQAERSAYEALTAEICNILKNELNVPPSRTYVEYQTTENWGFNGGNF